MSLFIRLLFLLFYCSSLVKAKEIALTFDDIPMPAGALYGRQERIFLILEQLHELDVKAAFFCIGQYLTEPSSKVCIDKISQANHALANHSFSHRSLSTISLEDFAQETRKTDSLLSPYATRKKWYRFPYLDFGNREDRGGSVEKKEQAFSLLKREGFIHGYVTINTFDWLIEDRMQKALRKGKHVNFSNLKKVYLTLMGKWIEDFENIWNAVSKKEVAHVLLLHGNDLNALFLTDLVAFLRQSGWTLIAPEKAYKDPELHYSTLGELHLQRLGIPYTTPSSLSISLIDAELDAAQVFSVD